VQYSPSRKGYVASLLPQVQNHDHAISVGEISSELSLTSRPADGPDGEALSDEEDVEPVGVEGEEGEEAE
jgi:hypothetical protein